MCGGPDLYHLALNDRNRPRAKDGIPVSHYVLIAEHFKKII